MSLEADPRYFDKLMFLLLTNKIHLPDKYLKYFLTSPAILKLDNPAILLIIAGYAREKRFIKMSDDDIKFLYIKAGELFASNQDFELAEHAKSQAENFAKFEPQI